MIIDGVEITPEIRRELQIVCKMHCRAVLCDDGCVGKIGEFGMIQIGLEEALERIHSRTAAEEQSQ